MVMECCDVSKSYGSVRALEGVSFVVPDGEVSCLVGQNGAGKTTVIKALLGLIAVDAGSLRMNQREGARRIGVVFGPEYWVGSRTGEQSLKALALAMGVSTSRVPVCLGEAGLGDAARRRVRAYSLGMRQRLSIAAALLGESDNLILDEPFVGLDPEGVRWLGNLLRDLAREGRAVLVSSHLLAELESVGDRVIVLNEGRVVADTPVADLRQFQGARLRVHDSERFSSVAARRGWHVERAGRDSWFVIGVSLDEAIRALAEAGVGIEEAAASRGTISDFYFDAVARSREGEVPR